MTDVQSVYQRGLDGPPLGPNLRGHKRVAVIGAGASGLCSAKYLLQAGFDVTVFEIGSQIGGMWCFNNDSGRSSAYRIPHAAHQHLARSDAVQRPGLRSGNAAVSRPL
jgi:cation diffusion facilitator CzcD-associated flavoprotein CzcO